MTRDRIGYRTTRVHAAPLRTPTYRGGQPSGPPAKNDTGLPTPPSGGHGAPDAHNDTETMPWNEEWSDSGKPKLTPEDTNDPTRVVTNENGKPSEQPNFDESTKITTSAPVPLSSSPNDESHGTGLAAVVGDEVPLDLAATKSNTLRIDNPPSPADVPDDMRFDPEGEGTPGLMPPVPAPSPSAESDKE